VDLKIFFESGDKREILMDIPLLLGGVRGGK
jgi:hypothetical protein